MLVADVAVGNAFRTYERRLPRKWCPPSGYNSVVAEVRPYTPVRGKSLGIQFPVGTFSDEPRWYRPAQSPRSHVHTRVMVTHPFI